MTTALYALRKAGLLSNSNELTVSGPQFRSTPTPRGRSPCRGFPFLWGNPAEPFRLAAVSQTLVSVASADRRHSGVRTRGAGLPVDRVLYDFGGQPMTLVTVAAHPRDGRGIEWVWTTERRATWYEGRRENVPVGRLDR